MPSPANAVPPELIGALASTFANAGGPSHSILDDAINAAGLPIPVNPGNKSRKVRAAFDGASPAQARALVEHLVHVIRDNGYYDLPAHETELRRTQAAVSLVGGTLSDEGFLTWESVPTSSRPVTAPAPPHAASPVVAPPAVGRPGSQHLAMPTHERLLSILRRLPGALKPLVGSRRVDQTSLVMSTEYDLQDAVEIALRLVYDDVRPEERAPSFAGSSTTPDFLLPEVRTAIEVKVTRAGRTNVHVKGEILIDTESYLRHPDVHRLVFVVYDLAGTITNPAGFERDLSQPINGHPRDTLVVDWPY